MICPFSNEECTEVDTSGMDKMTECAECEVYIKAQIEDWDEFMMSL